MTTIRAELGDITIYPVDAIVNAANSALLGGGGVDGAIHRAGGPTILEECRAIVSQIGRLEPGKAVITGAGHMPSRFVIHTVGPIWGRATPEQDDATLRSAYTESLSLAATSGCRSIAFPNISTGVYGYPKPRAAAIAIRTVTQWTQSSPEIDAITFVCFGQENLDLYQGHLA